MRGRITAGAALTKGKAVVNVKAQRRQKCYRMIWLYSAWVPIQVQINSSGPEK
jgi:hypothetical protein